MADLSRQFSDNIISTFLNKDDYETYMLVSKKFNLIATRTFTLPTLVFVKRLQKYIQYGKKSLVKALLMKNDPSAKNNFAIKYALENGYLDTVKYLMESPETYGINLEEENDSTILSACVGGHLEVVKYLMALPEKYETNPSNKYNYAFKYACQFGHLEIVKYLMSLPSRFGIDPSVDDNYPIRMAYKYRDYPVVEYLLSLLKKYGVYIYLK